MCTARGVTARDTLKSSRHTISQHARRRRQRIARAAGENNARQVNDIEEEMGAGRRQRVQVRVQLRGSGERGAERRRRDRTVAMLTAHHGHAKSMAAVMCTVVEG